MRSGLEMEIRIRSKLCGAETCPKTFINSFIKAIPSSYFCRLVAALLELDVEPQRPQLLDQHVEGFRNAGLEVVVAADDRLVDLGAARHVVGLHRQHFLERISGAVGFERPHFHFAKALAAELRLAAQRLLGHEAVGTDRPGVNLVVDQVMELQHVDVADRDLAVEGIAGASVDQSDLARGIEARFLQHGDDVVLARAVEHGARNRHAETQIVAELEDLLVIELLDVLAIGLVDIDVVQHAAQLARLVALAPRLLDDVADLTAETRRSPSKMGFENLADIHAARHAERIEHDVDRRAVFQIRHVLDRHDPRDHALVAVTAGHLVTGLQLALHRDEDLDHLHHAGRQLVAALQLLDLGLEALLQPVDGLVHHLPQPFDFGHALFALDRDLLPLIGRKLGEHAVVETRARLEALGTGGRLLAAQQMLHAREVAALQDGALVVAILGETFDFRALDGESALVLVDATAGEDAHFDDGAGHAGRQTQAGVANVGSLLAEDRAQQLLFRRHRRFALRRHLADQNVARLDLGPDIDDARLVEILERLFADIGNVAGDFFLAELGVARHHLEFLDMDRGEDVVRHDPLGDQDRILEVVAVPRHESAQHVAAERQLAELRRRTVADDVAGLDDVADADQRTLGDAGVLVRALELQQIVDIDAFGFGRGLFGGANDDAHAVDLIDHAGTTGDDGDAGIARHRLLHAGADERRFGADQRHRLALHVRAHERTVGVVVLEEGDQRRGDRNELFRRDIDEIDILRPCHDEIAGFAAIGQVGLDLAVTVGLDIRLGNGVAALFHGGEVDHLVRHLAVDDLAVRAFDEAIGVDPRIGRQAVDQADVRAFRRFDRTDPAVMRRMHVAHLEAGALARQTARTQRREAPLVGDLRQRVGLIHELRKLGRAEEFADRRRRRLGVDQIMRHDGVDLDRAHALADRAFHSQQADAILIFHQLADRADTPVAEMIDVVDLAATVLEIDQHLEDSEDVLLAQGAHGIFGLEVEARVHLDASDSRQIVAFAVKEQIVEQRFRGLERRRLARAHDTIDIDERLFAGGVLVDHQRIADVRAAGLLVERQRRHLVETGSLDGLQQLLGDFVAGLGIDFAGLLVDEVGREIAADHLFGTDLDLFEAIVEELLRQLRRQLFARFELGLAGARVE